jgi:hypothetical protein
MAEILNVSTVERHLFGPDAIPWQHLKLPSNLQKLQERYKFSVVRQGVDPQGNVIELRTAGGEFTQEDLPNAIEYLALTPNVVEFQLSVTSENSGFFFDDLKCLLTEIDPNPASLKEREYAKTYRTMVTARLAVPFEALLSERLNRFIRESAEPKVRLPDASAEVTLEHLSWKVIYKTKGTDYEYLPKQLTIEPRAGSNPKEQLYYTQSPTEFKAHMEMLVEFERRFAEAGAP